MNDPEVHPINEVQPINRDDQNLAMLAHLLGIVSGFIGALVIWLSKKDQSTYIDEQAREALNFQITIMIGFVVAYILTYILIGILLFPVLVIANLVLCILAAIAVSEGKHYRYPFALRLLK